MLDENEELPIRKPQSAYVIFGKMVLLQIAFIHKFNVEARSYNAPNSRDKSDRGGQTDSQALAMSLKGREAALQRGCKKR